MSRLPERNDVLSMARFECGEWTGMTSRLCNAYRGVHYHGVGAVVLPPRRERHRGVVVGVVVDSGIHPRGGGTVAWFASDGTMEFGRIGRSGFCGLRVPESRVAALRLFPAALRDSREPGEGRAIWLRGNIEVQGIDESEHAFGACEMTHDHGAPGIEVQLCAPGFAHFLSAPVRYAFGTSGKVTGIWIPLSAIAWFRHSTDPPTGFHQSEFERESHDHLLMSVDYDRGSDRLRLVIQPIGPDSLSHWLWTLDRFGVRDATGT